MENRKNLFKKLGGSTVEDLTTYITDYLKKENNLGTSYKSSNMQICIGCDSVSKNKNITYAITIVFYNPEKHNGAHYVFKRLKVPKSFLKKQIKISQWEFNEIEDFKYDSKMDLNDLIISRLWNEVEYLMELGLWLDEELQGKYFVKHTRNEHDDSMPFRLPIIHLDLNPKIGIKEQNKSNKIYNSAVGMLTGLGFKVVAKPNAYASSSAGDLLCK